MAMSQPVLELPMLAGEGRTGRLIAEPEDQPAVEVWIEYGRVVDAAWGQLRGLSALEMAALFLPATAFRFDEGLRSGTHSLDLSATDVAARLAQVTRTGRTLVEGIPSVTAIPRPTGRGGHGLEAEALRLLERIDGSRSVADLVGGRQPLTV